PQKKAPHALDPELTFEQFIVTSQTEVLYDLLQHIETSPFNPIYLHGPAFSGKTHLLTATALFLQKKGKKVCYQKAEKFTEQVIQAMRNGQMRQLRTLFRSADVLLIDDVHHFARKFATQEEFFHTFNELHTSGRQILLSSRLPPSKLEEIEPRLISRFEWGVTLETFKVDPAQILHVKATLWKLSLAPDVIPYLVEQFPNTSLVALTALAFRTKEGELITISIIEKLLKDLLEKEKQDAWTAEKILKKVADHYGILKNDLLGKSQTKEIALPRQVAIYLCRELLKLPFQQIGKIFSRDHSTIISSITKVRDLIQKENELAQWISKCIE
ncbi:MAG: ATP-binding protein, partial [Chlamydiia bacterium]|nr:ATP-binding protein [Chlamydiia bacterium]